MQLDTPEDSWDDPIFPEAAIAEMDKSLLCHVRNASLLPYIQDSELAIRNWSPRVGWQQETKSGIRLKISVKAGPRGPVGTVARSLPPPMSRLSQLWV